MTEKEIKNFVRDLAKTKTTPHTINQYSYENKENKIRRDNLIAYLSILNNRKPKVLLIAEAPGYRGSRRTGVPFSSEKIILSHNFFISHSGFRIENLNEPFGESSASVVWKIMDELKFYPLIWSSFPFHPHEPGNTESNRKPTKKELELGQHFIKSLIRIFGINEVIAVGRVAEKSLNDLNIVGKQIRHPSHGGANLFRLGLKQLHQSQR